MWIEEDARTVSLWSVLLSLWAQDAFGADRIKPFWELFQSTVAELFLRGLGCLGHVEKSAFSIPRTSRSSSSSRKDIHLFANAPGLMMPINSQNIGSAVLSRRNRAVSGLSSVLPLVAKTQNNRQPVAKVGRVMGAHALHGRTVARSALKRVLLDCTLGKSEALVGVYDAEFVHVLAKEENVDLTIVTEREAQRKDALWQDIDEAEQNGFQRYSV